MHGFDNVTLYNYSAVNNLNNDDQNRIDNNNNGKSDGNELFYLKISRDILFVHWIKYLNVWNYLAIITDINKYH